MWLAALESGSVLVVDEIESSMHPLLTRHLIEMVQDAAINTNHAQLIFTTHDTGAFGSDPAAPGEAGQHECTVHLGAAAFTSRMVFYDFCDREGILIWQYFMLPAANIRDLIRNSWKMSGTR